MAEVQLNVRYDTDLIGDFLKEADPSNEYPYITELMEKAENNLIDLFEDDQAFVDRFNKIVESNKDLAMLLAVHMIRHYDQLAEKSKERVRNAVKDAVMGSQADLLESKFKLLREVSGRLAASNIADQDLKLFDLVSNLVEYKSGDLSDTSSILREINNDIAIIDERLREAKKETL